MPADNVDPMLRYFMYENVPGKLQKTLNRYHSLAQDLVFEVKPGSERTVALRKLLHIQRRRLLRRDDQRQPWLPTILHPLD